MALGALWGQFFFALAPAWLGGQYYDYGWYVPVAAVYFFGRRWREVRPAADGAPAWGRGDWWSVAGLLPVLLVLRTLEQVDPQWRLPLWGHAVVVATATLMLVGKAAGKAAAWHVAPVVLFALTAVPYPTVVEVGLVRGLTDAVVALVVEIFNLGGVPVTAAGDRLVSGGITVEVTEGCSGIRSFQSFLMAGVFFGELCRFRLPGRVAMVLTGVALALLVNTGRTLALAAVGFSHGPGAVDNVHDVAGMVSFVISAVLFYAAALFIERHSRDGGMVAKNRKSAL
jgi:exosortase